MRRSRLPLILTVLCLRLPAPLGAAAAQTPAPPPPATPAADTGERDPADFPRPAGLVRQSFEQHTGVQRTEEIATYHTPAGLDDIAGRYREALELADWKAGQHSDSGIALHRVMIVDWDRPAREAEIRFYGAKDGTDLWVRVFTYPARASVAAKAAESLTPGVADVVTVPNVRSKPVNIAEAILYDANLNVLKAPGRLDSGNGNDDARVAEQNPAAGQMVPRGSTVTIVPWIGTGRVPNVVGRTVDQAKATLTGTGVGPTHGIRFTVEVGPAQPNPDQSKDGIVAEQSPAAGTLLPLKGTVTLTPWAALAPVPNVVGKPVTDAKSVLTGTGPGGGRGARFAVEVGAAKPTMDHHDDERVAEQTPAAGQLAPARSTVRLTPWAALTPVPNVVGMGVTQAKATLEGNSLTGGRGVHFAVVIGPAAPTPDQHQDDRVSAQNPAAGERAPMRSTVTLTPWAAVAPMPNVVGKTVVDAKALLTGTGPNGGRGLRYTVEVGPAKPTTDHHEDGRVAEQTPAAGQPAPARSTVTLIPWAELCPVAGVVGQSLAEARMTLRSGRGGSFVVQTAEPRPTLDPDRDGIVAAQDPAAGAPALRGSTVTLTAYQKVTP